MLAHAPTPVKVVLAPLTVIAALTLLLIVLAVGIANGEVEVGY